MPDSKHKKVWREMCNRCHNKDRQDYEYYGARGITVCDAWRESYTEFERWSLTNGYEDGLTIERVENNLGYNPDNCKWATRAEQVLNRRLFKNNKSGYTGVSYHSRNNKWLANINVEKVRVYLGSYLTALEAVHVRNAYIQEHKLTHKIQEERNE